MTYYPEQAEWIELAESLKPTLKTALVPALTVVSFREAVPRTWFRYEIDTTIPAAEVFSREWPESCELIFDFGRECVGTPRFEWDFEGDFDCPFRVHLFFGETSDEVLADFDRIDGSVGRGWLQDAILLLDIPQSTVELTRRYAFRYLRLKLVRNSPRYRVRLLNLQCRTVTSADDKILKPLPPNLAGWNTIDHCATATLACCMQTVFEDGPKRDRRLWLGDLRLQAMTNYVTFRNDNLVKRCLYLFAGLAHADGQIPACLYEYPTPHTSTSEIYDYTALFPCVLREYLEATGDSTTAAALWPVAKRQIELILTSFDATGLFRQNGSWCFVDWCEELDRNAAEQGIVIFAVKQTAQLARQLCHHAEATKYQAIAQKLSSAAFREFYNPENGFFESGPNRQISWASQIWMVLGGVIRDQAAGTLMRRLANSPAALKPNGPYLYHYAAEAMIIAGEPAMAMELLKSYWGKMLELGAVTFWEVFNPADCELTPYGRGDARLFSSMCHAWSCTPAWFIRTLKDAKGWNQPPAS